MQIDKIMHRNVKIIGPDETLRDAATAMKKLDVGVLPVGEHDKLVGMITDRDIAIRGIAEGKGPDTKVAAGFAFAELAAGIARRTGARSRRPVSGECRRHRARR
jgi:CBS domain-containing protein